MVRSLAGVSVFIFFCGAFPVLAAEQNILNCTLTKAYECTPDDGCTEWTVEEMALPRFVRIDLNKNTIVSLDKNVKREDTRISQVKDLEDVTVIQGTEKRGWSIALAKDTGDLSLSASGDGDVYVVFGNCMNP